MKNLSIIYKLFLLISFFASYKSYATEDPWIEKRRFISKTYPLNSNTEVKIINSFGQVKVNNWNRNEIKVDITIMASSKDEQIAQNILDGIRINENYGREILFETKIGNTNINNKRQKVKNTESKMEINYEVFLPEGTPLTVKNSFGKTFIPDRTGVTDLTQSFGDLDIGTLNRIKQISIEFGKLYADKLDGGKMSFKFSDIDIDAISGIVNTNFEFCKKPEIGLSKDLKEIKINSSYSDILINVARTLNATLDVKTSFGEVKNNTRLNINDETKDKKGPVFDRTYSGKTGTGETRIIINSSFGKIVFN